MANCLVLGANGFIGSHLVDSLVSRNHSVRAFDRFSDDNTLFHARDSVEVFSGDFLNIDDLVKALDGIDYVFHFISTTNPATVEDNPLIDIETNVRMSVELFQACVKAQVKRVLFASTGGAIYGNDGLSPRKETDLALPVSPYAIGKLTIEHYLRYFKVKHNLDSVTFRIANPYGERQPLHRKQGVIPIFLESVIAEDPITVLGDGTMVRDYIYVKDVANMLAEVFDKPAKYTVYNLGSGSATSVNEIVRAVEAATGKSATIKHQPVPSTFIDKIVLDTTRFSDEFNLSPKISLSEGIVATLAYINKYHEGKNE